MNGRSWNALRRYTCGSAGVSRLLQTPGGHLVHSSSFIFYNSVCHKMRAMAVPTSVAVGTLPVLMDVQTYARAQSLSSLAASLFTGCTSASRRNGWTVRTPRIANVQFAPSLIWQPEFATTAKERHPQLPYRKKKKRGKAKGVQASKQPAGEVAAEPYSSKTAKEKSVVVVESPAKAKTIEKYLGEGYVVLPSFGHVRDLAAKAGSVRPEEDYQLVWEVPSSARQHLNSIKAAVKGANSLVLASDPDREGEAIAWHVLEMLKMEGAVKSNLNVSRVVFNEITKAAVLRAMEGPRDISTTLVDAYLARRALDYLIGFDLSPVLWRKLPGSKSAGRVQSAALRLVCEREWEMEAFVPQQYWTINAEVSLCDKGKNRSTSDADYLLKQGTFPAKVTHVDGQKLSQFTLSSEAQAQAVAEKVEIARLSVSSVRKSVVKRNPLAPYITSTLQQDASNKLTFGASRTMALAQQLYEGVKLDDGEVTGLITYMRTDGVQLSSEAVQNIRLLIVERYGDDYIPQKSREFTSRVKNAQEAHEAIRPTDIRRLPSMLVNILEDDALRLYSLIWCRTIACQMAQANFAQVAIEITNDAEDLELRATGSSMSFPGFLAAFRDKVALASKIEDDTDEGGDSQIGGEILQCLEAGDILSLNKVQSNQHCTEAPPRYSEGSLVKRLEDLGIGRPSTYASTLKTLQTRTYVRIEKRRIFPEGRGRMVSAFLSHYFPRFSDYEFTAKLESQLDEVSAGRVEWKKVLSDFWPDFHAGVTTVLKIPFEEVVNLLEEVFAEQFFSSSKEKLCPSCRQGKMGLRLSRFGSGYFLGCSRYPNCMYKTNVLSPDGVDLSDDEDNTSKLAPSQSLGVDSSSGLEVFLKAGPFGKYLQLGSGSSKQKPKRTAIPKERIGQEIGLPEALELLKYPYELGQHPETNETISVHMGKYGPFVRCRAMFVSVPKESLEVLTVEKAVALLQSKNVSRRGRRPRGLMGNTSETEAVPSNKEDETALSNKEDEAQPSNKKDGNEAVSSNKSKPKAPVKKGKGPSTVANKGKVPSTAAIKGKGPRTAPTKGKGPSTAATNGKGPSTAATKGNDPTAPATEGKDSSTASTKKSTSGSSGSIEKIERKKASKPAVQSKAKAEVPVEDVQKGAEAAKRSPGRPRKVVSNKAAEAPLAVAKSR